MLSNAQAFARVLDLVLVIRTYLVVNHRHSDLGHFDRIEHASLHSLAETLHGFAANSKKRVFIRDPTAPIMTDPCLARVNAVFQIS